MEPTKNSSDEPGRTTGGSTGTSGTTGTGSSAGRTGGAGGSGLGSTGGSSTVGGGSMGGSTGSTGSSTMGGGTTGGSGGGQTGSAPQRARETNTGGGQSAYDQTKQTMTDAYGKTTEVLSNTYDQAMSYGRDNPGKLTLIAFGAGIAIGLLLAGSGGRSRTNRIAEPVVNALSQVAMEFFR
ncbi:MAG TPA: hypothetical protein VF762_24780 [Blastocatellia bacterium]